MEWTEIASIPHAQKVYTVRNLDKLKARSAQRVKSNPTFQEVAQNAQRMKDQRDDSVITLELTTYQNRQKSLQEKIDAYKALFEQDVVFGVENLPVDVAYIEAEEGRKARNEDW
ncbi:carboxy terminal-processing peptidase, partial [Arthrospira platensis SPKY1]|nr:carboxy terminal-processing peptidase [Arthrospira platensis SPKY1]